ncbi:orotate phosphoribosyltransferase [Cryptotrichosporon argae]
MSTSTSTIDPAKAAFIAAAIDNGVLLFGEFTLKSGRSSPYFFNAGLLYTGALLSTAADAFAHILSHSRIPEFDVLLGPAYKGIPLAAVTAVALSKLGRDKAYCYNRKEKKDHGEGGVLVGAPLAGRIVIIDDVITAGTAIREAITLLQQHAGAELVGIVQLVDRQERGKGATSSIQEVEAEFGIPVEPIISLSDIIAYLRQTGGYESQLAAVEKYRAEYGV